MCPAIKSVNVQIVNFSRNSKGLFLFLNFAILKLRRERSFVGGASRHFEPSRSGRRLRSLLSGATRRQNPARQRGRRLDNHHLAVRVWSCADANAGWRRGGREQGMLDHRAHTKGAHWGRIRLILVRRRKQIGLIRHWSFRHYLGRKRGTSPCLPTENYFEDYSSVLKLSASRIDLLK